jgi:hypothetical protein
MRRLTTVGKVWMAGTFAIALACAGCVTGGAMGGAGGMQGANHLSPQQCVDLTALRDHAPPSHQRNMSELAALEAAGYDPSLFFDPYYPDDLHAAQQQVDIWYRTECQQALPG